MQQLLKDFEKKWKQYPTFSDVRAQRWEPNEEMVEKCTEGCQLEVQGKGWERIPMRDALCYEIVCREHGFARIYVISGPSAMTHNWKP